MRPRICSQQSIQHGIFKHLIGDRAGLLRCRWLDVGLVDHLTVEALNVGRAHLVNGLAAKYRLNMLGIDRRVVAPGGFSQVCADFHKWLEQAVNRRCRSPVALNTILQVFFEFVFPSLSGLSPSAYLPERCRMQQASSYKRCGEPRRCQHSETYTDRLNVGSLRCAVPFLYDLVSFVT